MGQRLWCWCHIWADLMGQKRWSLVWNHCWVQLRIYSRERLGGLMTVWGRRLRGGARRWRMGRLLWWRIWGFIWRRRGKGWMRRGKRLRRVRKILPCLGSNLRVMEISILMMHSVLLTEHTPPWSVSTYKQELLDSWWKKNLIISRKY